MSSRALLLAGLALPLGAQDWALQPVDVQAGPLLLFAVDVGAGPERAHAWHVAEFAGTGPAHEFLRAGDNVSFVARLDLRRLLVADHGAGYGIHVVDLQRGEHRRIGDNAWVFVGTRGGEVLYLGDERKGDRALYARPWTHDGKPRVVAAPFERVLVGDGDLAFGVGPGDGPAVSAIDLLHGGARQLLRLPAGHDADATRLAVSPDGRRLAVGLHTGVLLVHDVATGERRAQWRDIPLALPALSSSSPRLEVGWRDGDTVVASESRGNAVATAFVFVARSVASGEVVATTPYDGNLSHQAPHAPLPRTAPLHGWIARGERWSRGAFACDGDDLFWPGGKEPIAHWRRESGWPGDVMFTPDAAFAVVQWEQDRTCVDVLDGASHSRRRVFGGAASAYTWLPAVP